MFKIQTLNNISSAGLHRLAPDGYQVATEVQHPDAILLRSFDMHGMEIPHSLKAVGRAGAGVNNIPVEALSKRGIPVFNTPGANAGAVAEITLAALFLAARNICRAWEFARALPGDDDEIDRRVEAGKKQFRGFELPGRVLGVIGLGAIGVRVANAALGLGMRVVGYDPEITVQRAWQLSSQVQQALSVGDLLGHSDFVSIHVPLTEQTRYLINGERIGAMREGACLLNFSRRTIVDETAVLDALNAGRLHAYVCDFPSERLSAHPRVVALPHIGASTREAEDNCAIMVAEQVRDFLEDGIIRNSVNFPDVVMPRVKGYRLAVVNANVPNMLGQISTCVARADLNIVDMLNNSRGQLAYTLIDVDEPVPQTCLDEIAAIEGVMSVRAL
jgi:D-3-phosphoglycerate dehydrogenase